MQRFRTFLFVLVCSAVLIPVAQAQTGKGTIAGRVTDSSNGALIGAQVTVQPTGVDLHLFIDPKVTSVEELVKVTPFGHHPIVPSLEDVFIALIRKEEMAHA